MAHHPKPWYRKSRGVWYVQIDGKQHNLGADRAQAFELYHRLMAQPRNEPKVASDSVAAIFDAFLEWTGKHRAITTYEWYKERLQRFVNVLPADVTVAELRQFHVQEWLDAHPSWSSAYQRGCASAVQRALQWAVRMGHIAASPVAYLEKPRAGKREFVITAELFKKVVETASDGEFRDLLEVSWEVGCRPQESLRVEARHVDLRNSRWVFTPSEAKVKTRPRIVYLTESALAITQRRMLKHPEGPIFRNSKGRPWTPYAVNCRFERLKKHVGKKLCLYLFRHAFATRLLEAGVDSLTVAILLGHVNPAMLSTTYQHLSHNPKHLLDQLRRASA